MGIKKNSVVLNKNLEKYNVIFFQIWDTQFEQKLYHTYSFFVGTKGLFSDESHFFRKKDPGVFSNLNLNDTNFVRILFKDLNHLKDFLEFKSHFLGDLEIGSFSFLIKINGVFLSTPSFQAFYQGFNIFDYTRLVKYIFYLAASFSLITQILGLSSNKLYFFISKSVNLKLLCQLKIFYLKHSGLKTGKLVELKE